MNRFSLGFLLALAFAAATQFAYLSFGTPSWDKHLQIFGSRQALEQAVPAMIELRKKYWSAYANMLDPKRTEGESREIYKQTFLSHEQVPLFSPFPREMILDRARGYLIGVLVSDDQYPMVAISNLDPRKLDFNPNIYAASGGFYYYTGGALLMAAKLAGLISLTPGIEYYFTHPEESARMYSVLRAIGGLSVLAALALLFFWLRARFDPATAALAAGFLAATAGTIILGHTVKAHLYGMFWLTLGFYFYSKILEKPETKYYGLGALFLGLCAGSIVTNLSVGILLFIVEWVRCGWNPVEPLKSRNFWLACAVFGALYFATNFYVFLDLPAFQKTIWALKEYTKGYDEYGTVNWTHWLPFFREFFTNQVHWITLPLAAAGAVAAARGRDKLLQACLASAIALTLLNLLTTRHPGVNSRVFPLLAILCAAGARFLWGLRAGTWRAAVGAYVAAALAVSAAQTLFYVGLLHEPSNLMRAGAWINGNVPAGASIGAVGGQISQSGFPPFRFLDYAIVHLPGAAEYAGAPPERPEYVVATEVDHPLLLSGYELVHSWKRPARFLGIPFESKWLTSGNVDLFVFKRAS